jgi:hypothetical protein
MLGGEVHALTPQIQLRQLDHAAQSLKQEVFTLNRDLLILGEELRYPPATRVAVFLSVDADQSFQLNTVEITIDNEMVASHRYTERETTALVRGGVQRIYVGNLAIGEHELSASVNGKDASGEDYRQSGSMIFYKRNGPKFVEMTIVKPAGKRQPELHLPMTVADRQARHVKDPYFGAVLFNVYQERYFSAVTGLLAAQATNNLSQHQHESRWLLGDLYLAYGLHRQAARMFTRLMDQGTPPDVAARARFYLAKSWYRRGHLKQAQDALLRMRDPLPAELKDRQQVLLALVLMKRNRSGEAVAVLSQLRGKSERATYARYNMGVGLIRIGRTKEGVALLGKIARMRARDDELLALRDKANLALGFAFLGVPDPGRAKSYFREVRLNGPFSNKALLGLGWALSARGKHKQSLVPWMELQKRTDIDVAVQESLLAVPYALSELEAYKQALQHYENAIAVYNAEIERLRQTVEGLRTGERLASVVAQSQPTLTERISPEQILPDTPENRYLIQLFASNDFHEALKNYRHLQTLARHLDCWSAALAGSNEQDLARAIATVEQELGKAPGNATLADDQEHCGRLNDSQHWQFSRGYKPSLWQTNATSRAPASAIAAAGSRISASQNTPQREDESREAAATRLSELRARVFQLKTEVARAVGAHEQYLQDRAAQELERQNQRLRAYVTQARFGIAHVYDRASSHAQ